MKKGLIVAALIAPTPSLSAAASPVHPAAAAPKRGAPLTFAQRSWTQRQGNPWPFEALTPTLSVPSTPEHPGPYGLRPAKTFRSVAHEPTDDETRRARAEYRRISEGEEIFDAPIWMEKLLEPGLEAAFGVARIEDMLLDYANAVSGDPVDSLKAMRDRDYALWREAVARRRAMKFPPLPAVCPGPSRSHAPHRPDASR
ncbi:MAG: hypothetical protein COV48_06840 [Elusimicrobia bacterium CG11_big_fil_rev_8_21_14_0_20_64_6]|nr:MAG: hypothetical protein COV48_06840 [Elusimicrobia bacterium CG11_big_fil_rev_8_21_14_0_20_64_6]